MLIQLAWRNLWRVPRRTVIILASIAMGVWAMVFMRALMAGVMDQMLENGIRTLTGHVQIHREGYRKDPVIDRSMTNPEEVFSVLEDLPEGIRWTRRVRVPGVASNARHSAGVVVVGIDPARESEVSFVKSAVKEGSYLGEDDSYSLLIGAKLAEKFRTGLGKKVVLVSRDSAGEMGGGGFRIQGIFHADMEATEERFVFILLDSARKMLHMGEGISEISLMAPSPEDAASLSQWLRSRLPEGYEVVTWRELLPLVTSSLRIWDGFIAIWYAIVFAAMAFGLVNTMLIAVFERFREFGILRAIGMKPRWLVLQIVAEASWLLLSGIVLGDFLSWATIGWLEQTGIDLGAFAEGAEKMGFSRVIYPLFHWTHLAEADAVVLALGLAVNLYPALRAARVLPVEAMAHS